MAWKDRYFKMGLVVFCTVSAILLFYDTLFGSKALQTFYRQFTGALRPVLYGAFMAYLLAPMVNFFEHCPAPPRAQQDRTEGRQPPPAIVRAVSILLTWAVVGMLLYLLASVLLPELCKSVFQLISKVEN